MAGIMNQDPALPTGGAPASGAPPNAMLEKIISGIEAKLDAKVKTPYETIVAGGMKILFSDETHHLLTIATQKVKAKGNEFAPEGAAMIAQGLIAMLFKASNKTLSLPGSFPAAMTLACHVLEFFVSNGIQVDQNSIAKTMAMVTQKLMNLFHITPKQFDDAKKGIGQPAPAEQTAEAGAPAPGAMPVEAAPPGAGAAPTGPPGVMNQPVPAAGGM